MAKTDQGDCIPIGFLRECFDCDALGVLRWKVRPASHFQTKQAHSSFNSKYAGDVVGRLLKGYVVASFNYQGKRHYLSAHRIVWALHAGTWPGQHVDHINRIRNDNRIENLRDVAPDENLRNNGNPHGTGLLGAYMSRGERFYSQIALPGGGTRYLGRFATAQEAHSAHIAAKAQLMEAA